MARRKAKGEGSIRKRSDGRWEGHYSPVWLDGKKHSRNVYAKTSEKCEEKLKGPILEMKAGIATLRSGISTEYPVGVSPQKWQLPPIFESIPVCPTNP